MAKIIPREMADSNLSEDARNPELQQVWRGKSARPRVEARAEENGDGTWHITVI